MLDEKIHQHLAAKVLRKRPRTCLVDPHQRRLDHKPRIEPQVQGHLQRLQRVIPAIRVARIIRLAHAAHEMAQAPSIGNCRGRREEQDVAPRNKCRGQPVAPHLDGDIRRQRRLAHLPDDRKIQHVVRAQPRTPIRKGAPQARHERFAHLQLHGMPLPVRKTNGLDSLETRKRPRQAGRGILPARKQNQGLSRRGLSRMRRHATCSKCGRRLGGCARPRNGLNHAPPIFIVDEG